MTLEKFTKQQAANYPAITIRRTGTLCINGPARDQFKLKEISFVTLHYDRNESTMCIKPSDEHDSSAFRITKEKGRTFAVSCQSFLSHFGIPYQESTRSYRATWDDKAKMIVVKLQQSHSKEVKT